MGNLLLKWLINGVIAIPLLMWFAGVTFWSALIAATVLTVLAYLIGDQVVLRATNNTFATVADFLLAAIYFYLVGYVYRWDLTLGEVIVLSAILAVGEWFVHRYVFQDRQRAQRAA